MSAPRVTFPDSRMVALGILREAVPLIPGQPTTLLAGTLDPEDRKEDKQGLPYVKVSHDGSEDAYPYRADARIRVTVWGKSEEKTLHLARLCRAILESFPGNASVRHTGNSTEPMPASDPDTQAPMAFFSIDIRLRPVPF